MGKVSAAPSPQPPPESVRRVCAGSAGGGNRRAPSAFARSPGTPHHDRRRRARRGRPSRCAVDNRARPWSGVIGAGGSAVPPRACAGRSVTKSRLGGGEEARPLRSLPTLSTSPALHVKRNNLFILGFKNPALLPVLRGRPAPPPSLPCSPRSCPVPPAAPPSSLSSSPPLPPARLPPPFWDATVGEGAGNALSASRPSSAPEAAGWEGRGPPPPRSPPPRSRPRARRRGGLGFEQERVSQSRGGWFSLYKQEAENRWHTVAFLIVPGGGASPASCLYLQRPSCYLFLPAPSGALPRIGRLTLRT